MIIEKNEVKDKKFFIFKEISRGGIFVYPTDTIYGLGCDAFDEAAIKKIRELKNRYDKPFSVIVPSKNWIYENCEVNDVIKEWLDKLPGPYTLILNLKKNIFPSNLNNGVDTIGIRMPDHWITEFVNEYGAPIVTTSANKTGALFMTNLDDLDIDIKNKVNFIIYEGELKGRPSKIVRFDSPDLKIVER